MTAIALSIAGSDSGGGAGIQADLKTFSALGVYGATVVTAVTAQNTYSVTAIHPIPADIIQEQIDAVLSDLDVRAVKIGMLANANLIECVSEALSDYDHPIILDPVMVSKSGANLLPKEAIETLRTHLIPQATLLTPNIPEAALLLDTKTAESDIEIQKQGEQLLSFGCKSVLMKGGHQLGDYCQDWLIEQHKSMVLGAQRVQTLNTHGTGCSYSSAVAANLAIGYNLENAVINSHQWLHQAIIEADSLNIGGGHGPVHHFHGLWK